jgi:putative transcriptional regulator
MHPELIKALIRIGGTTSAALADELGVSRMTVSNVIHGRGRSARIANRISEVVAKPVHDLWPGAYERRSGLRRDKCALRA